MADLKRFLRYFPYRAKGVWFGAAAVLIGVLLICNISLICGRAAPIWDAVSQFAPWFSLVSDNARQGRLLLWDPWTMGGSPDFAEPEAGTASPAAIIFGLIFADPFKGFIAYWLATWIFGGMGMLLLCRHLKCPPWGAVIVSLGFVANGFYTGHAEHTSMLYSYSFLPWVLWRFDTGFSERRYRGFIEAGALWGVSALGGYPQLTILEPFFLLLWEVGRVLDRSAGVGLQSIAPKSRKFLFVALLLFMIVGSAILIPTYLSFLTESRGYSARANALPREFAITSNLFPPGALSTFASPVLYLLELAPTVRWPNTDVSMVNFYMGAVVSVLAIAALLKFARIRLWLVFVAALFMSCAVGKYLPVRGWLYDLVPVTRFFRHAALFASFSMFTVAILAAFATRDIEAANLTEGWPRLDRFRFLAVSTVIVPLAYLSYQHLSMNKGQVLHPLYASVHFWFVWVAIPGIMLAWWSRAITAKDLYWALVVLCIFDAGSTLYLSASTLYSDGSLGWWNTMRSKHNGNLELGERGLNRNLHPPPDLADFYAHDRNIAIKDPELANLTPLTSRIFEAYVADPALYRVALGSNRFWFSSSPAWCPPDQRAFEDFAAFTHRVTLPPMVLHSRDDMLNGFARSVPSQTGQVEGCSGQKIWKPMVPANVRTSRYAQNRLVLSYRSPQKGWLMVTDRWARSWKATVNGYETPISGADFLFRAVPVSAGENFIVMWYRPSAYILFVVLSWVTLSVILLWEIQQFWIGPGRKHNKRDMNA